MYEQIKLKLALTLSLLTVFSCTLVYFSRVVVLGHSAYENIGILGMAVSYYISYFAIKKYKSINIFNSLLFIDAVIILMIRVYYTGGYDSMDALWHFMFLFIFTMMYKFKASLYYFIYFHGILFIAYATGELRVFENTVERGVILFFVSGIMMVLIYFYYRVCNRLYSLESQVKLEERTNRIKSALLHEINNPLTIANALAEIMVKKPNVDKRDDLHKSLQRMVGVMNKIRSLNSLTDLEIKEYEKDVLSFDQGKKKDD